MSISPQAWAFLGVIIGTAITVAGSVLVARIGSRTDREASRESSVLEWADQAWERLGKVEERVTVLEAQLATEQRMTRAAATFIDRIGLWIQSGMRRSKPKVPEILTSYIDTTLWVDTDPDGLPVVRPKQRPDQS